MPNGLSRQNRKKIVWNFQKKWTKVQKLDKSQKSVHFSGFDVKKFESNK